MNKDELHHLLTSIVGQANVLAAKEALAEYSRDALRPSRGFPQLARVARKPLAVARPGSTEQVAAIVKLANQTGVPLIPYGGGSGLMGGALCVKPGIVIDLKAMNRILDISPQDRMVRVEAGVVLENLEAELNKRGLILGHDPWSLPLATVGGAIATNGLGYRAAKYGSMGEQVMGLTVVLPDGSILRTRSIPKSSVGLDLKQLFIGTEGCFGIITEAALRVFLLPEERFLRAYSFSNIEDGFEAVAEMFALGLEPALLDYGESRRLPGAGILRGKLFQHQGPTLYLGFEGLKEVAAAEMMRADLVCQAKGGNSLGDREAGDFWDNRHWIAKQYARLASHKEWDRLLGLARNVKLDFVHVAVPGSQVLEYYRRCRKMLSDNRVYPVDWGIWTCPELFSVVMVKVSFTGQRADQGMSGAVDQLLSLAQAMGGSMEYCHGVGMRLAHLMDGEHGLGLEVMRWVKDSLDPHHIMNPGKLGL